MLLTAETFFKGLKPENAVKTWSLLTAKSKETITKDIYKESQSSGKGYTEEQIKADLGAGGPISLSYWKGFLSSFNPRTVLEESKWAMGVISSSSAEVLITYRKSDKPARLKMFKEGDAWKVGLVETFWTRK